MDMKTWGSWVANLMVDGRNKTVTGILADGDNVEYSTKEAKRQQDAVTARCGSRIVEGTIRIEVVKRSESTLSCLLKDDKRGLQMHGC